MNKLLATIAGVALSVLPAAAFASTATGSVTVNATVNAACSLSTGNPLNFPAYDPSGAGVSASAAESIICTNTTAWALSVPSTDVLTGPGGATLNASGITTSPLSGTSIGASQPFSVTGNIASGQYSTPGSYTGSVTVTATF